MIIKYEFVSRVAAMSKMRADQVRAVMAAMQSVAADELAVSGEVRVPGLAQLKLMDRPERPGRNPKTGKICMVPPGHTVKLRPASTFSNLVLSAMAKQPVQF